MASSMLLVAAMTCSMGDLMEAMGSALLAAPAVSVAPAPMRERERESGGERGKCACVYVCMCGA